MIALVLWALAQCPEMTAEEMDDLQNHAEASLRLASGNVLHAPLELAPPPWAFAPMPSNPEPFEE